MNNKLTRLKILYSELEYSEREEFKKFIPEFENISFSERDALNESFRKSLGPIDSAVCPRCGK